MELAHDAYGRDWWTRLADDLLSALRPYASANNARITPPGAEGGYGRDVDGLEGFARSLMIAGFRIAGERGQGVDDLIDFYASGIAAGVDPASLDRWVRPREHAQAKVESASIALVLDLTRPWIWDRFPERTKLQVIDYLGEVVGDDMFPRNNWLWFRIVVETFLRSVGGPWSADDIAADLALHESFLRSDGWISDGDGQSFDQYTGWALHLYPALWPHMTGAADLIPFDTARALRAEDRLKERMGADAARLDRFLLDARRLIGADGSPLVQGRSLIYRFAAAAPFWAGVLSEVPSTSLGALRVAAGRIVEHFVDRGAPDENGLLSMGWHHEWRQLAQVYSGPGSPYWAAKGLLGIMFPADHPVWTAPAEPLPVEQGDILTAIAAPGWVAHGTAADGLVRIVNHGTNHALPGTQVGDSPLYARIGYSTATSPLLDDDAWIRPLEQSVAVIDDAGRATHRAALSLLDVRVDGEVGVAGSVSTAHWIVPDPDQVSYGSGIEGRAEPAGRLIVWSLVRGPWELRLARLDELPEGLDPETLALRFGGWPLAADARDEIAVAGTTLSARGLTSRLTSVVGRATGSAHTHHEAGPLGPVSATPVLTFGVQPGAWVGAVVELSGRPFGDEEPTVALTADGDVLTAAVSWPDGQETTTRLLYGGGRRPAVNAE